MVSTSAFIGMGFYSLIGLANYTASIGYGIATVAVGGILTFTRIFDAITDPMLAFLYDKVNTRFGKVHKRKCRKPIFIKKRNLIIRCLGKNSSNFI